AVTDVTPLNNATGIALTSDLSVIFSEPVNLESGWFTITCNRSGSHTGDVTGLEPGAEFSIDPADNFFNDDICTIIIIAAKVHDDDPVDPPDNLVSDYPWSFTTVGETTGLLIHDIQGGSHLSPLDGTTVTNVPGIVTALTLHGFYYQDPNPDSDDDTSEGMYVYTESAPVVNVGDYVYVSGTVDEYQSEGYTNDLHLTEIVNPGLIITRVTADNALPLPVVLGDGGREIPNKIIHTANEVDIEAGETFDQLTDAVDLYESLEGMRVQINSALAVAPTNSYGETAVVGDNGAHASKFSGRGGLVTATDDFNPERLLLDDLIMTYAPMLTGQASVAPVYGVMTYTYNNYKVEITEAIDFGTSVFTPEIADDQKDTELTIASFNILNLHPGDGSRYAALADQIVTNLGSPDIVVLEEVEDNNGTGTGVVAADVTITTLITAITAKGGPTYEYSQIDPVNNADGGEPDGNIRVAFLFDPNRVGFVNHGAGDATTATLPVLVGGEVMLSLSPGRVDPGNSAWLDSRKPLAGEFIFRGKRIIVVGCHLNSRSGDTPLFGFAQPPVLNSEIQRIAQADVLNSFVVSILAMDANAKVVVAGDMNDFPFSTPLAHLTGYGSNKVMTNLYDFLPANERYTYIYDGNSQALDNIFVTNNMLSMPGSTLFDIVHINTEDAYTSRVSDHDPILAYLNLGAYFFSLPIVAKAP
ncbi:MAG: Ig-like domain-containing protein, partial [Anaerolineaceae bacterium]